MAMLNNQMVKCGKPSAIKCYNPQAITIGA